MVAGTKDSGKMISETAKGPKFSRTHLVIQVTTKKG